MLARVCWRNNIGAAYTTERHAAPCRPPSSAPLWQRANRANSRISATEFGVSKSEVPEAMTGALSLLGLKLSMTDCTNVCSGKKKQAIKPVLI